MNEGHDKKEAEIGVMLPQAKDCRGLLATTRIKKRWQKYTELYKKDLHDPGNHDGVITQPEPDILECEVKRSLGRVTTNKASRGDGIPVELF